MDDNLKKQMDSLLDAAERLTEASLKNAKSIRPDIDRANQEVHAAITAFDEAFNVVASALLCGVAFDVKDAERIERIHAMITNCRLYVDGCMLVKQAGERRLAAARRFALS